MRVGLQNIVLLLVALFLLIIILFIIIFNFYPSKQIDKAPPLIVPTTTPNYPLENESYP